MVKKWKELCRLVKKEQEVVPNENRDFKERLVARAYGAAWQAAFKKRGQLLWRADLEADDFGYCTLPYIRKEYLEELCGITGELVADIADMKREQVAVAFAFRHGKHSDISENDWFWVKDEKHGGSKWMREKSVQESRIFDETVNGSASCQYRVNAERKDTEESGSDLCMRVNFENMGRKYVDGVLCISTFGKSFQEAEALCTALYGEDVRGRFEYLLVNEALSVSKQLFQTELGLYYMKERSRHNQGIS